jgi:hypothetical protein
MGDWWFKQEYQCEFCETIDSVFASEFVLATLRDDIQPLVVEAR